MDKKLTRHTTQEQNSESENIVKTMIKTIETNKNFSKLIIYALNNLKSYLIIPVENQALEYSSIILKSNINNIHYLTNINLDNFVEIITAILPNHLNNEELLIKVGDVFVNLITQNNKQKETIKLFTNNSGCEILNYVFDNVDKKMTEVFKIFIKFLKILIDEKSYQYDTNLEQTIRTLFFKFEKNDDIIIYLLELCTTLLDDKANIELFSTSLLNEIVKLISQTDSDKIGNHCIHILDILSNEVDIKEKIRHYKSISFIIKLLTKFQNNNVLTYVKL